MFQYLDFTIPIIETIWNKSIINSNNLPTVYFNP